jgi:hypothetical protein
MLFRVACIWAKLVRIAYLMPWIIGGTRAAQIIALIREVYIAWLALAVAMAAIR